MSHHLDDYDHHDDFDASDDLERLGVTEESIDAALAEAEASCRPTLWPSLDQLLLVPDDLAARTTEGVSSALLTRSVLAASVDLLGIGWFTIRHLVGSEDSPTSKEASR